MTKKHCRVCGVELSEENWYASMRKKCNRCCKECDKERLRLWRKANPEKARAICTRVSRKRGVRPFDKTIDCPQFLGVHVAERVLSHAFKDVEVMPYGNPGYDFICNKGKKIDVKSSCIQKNGMWGFYIRRNTTADFFLCLAFDNREDLNPLHAWLIPGNKLNRLTRTTISQSTVHKWDEYRLDISKINDCCDALRAGGT